jgi:hypothetical protein
MEREARRPTQETLPWQTPVVDLTGIARHPAKEDFTTETVTLRVVEKHIHDSHRSRRRPGVACAAQFGTYNGPTSYKTRALKLVFPKDFRRHGRGGRSRFRGRRYDESALLAEALASVSI